MSPYKLLLFDLDGTLWRGSEPIPHAVETANELARLGFVIRYVTNNSTATEETVAAKLRAMGFPAETQHVYTSSRVAASKVSDSGLKRVFTVGESGLDETLQREGLDIVGSDEAQAVVCGLCRHFDYELLAKAQQPLLRGGKLFATNGDTTFPLEGGTFAPGAGSIVAAVAAAGGVTPIFCGKPEPQILRQAMQEEKCSPEATLTIGDRLDTDILCGLNAGCATFLVLTGVETELPDSQMGGPDLRSLSAFLTSNSLE